MAEPTAENEPTILDEPTAYEVRRKIIKQNLLLEALGRAIAPEINSYLDRIADRFQESVKRSFEDWCPGCGEKALLCPDLCEECLSVNSDTE